MNIWFRIAAIWGAIWATTMLACVLLQAPDYVIAGIGFGGGGQPVIWTCAGFMFKKLESAD